MTAVGRYIGGGGGLKINAPIETIVAPFDINKGDVVYKYANEALNSLVKQADPNILSYQSSTGCSWFKDGEDVYLIVHYSTGEYIWLYKLIDSNLVKQTSISSQPPGDGYGPDWIKTNGDIYLSVPHNGSPFITWYKLLNGTLVKQPDPDIIPAGDALRSKWISDGENVYLFVSHYNYPFLSWYKLADGLLVKQPNPNSLPLNTGNDVSCVFDGTTIHVSVSVYTGNPNNTNPKFVLYDVIDGLLVRNENIDVYPNYDGQCCCWLTDGEDIYLIVNTIGNATYECILYKLVDGALFYHQNMPTGSGYPVYSDGFYDGEKFYFAYTHTTNTPKFAWYRSKGDQMVKLSNVSSAIPGDAYGCSWIKTDEGIYIAFAHSTYPYISWYKAENSPIADDYDYYKEEMPSSSYLLPESAVLVSNNKASKGDEVKMNRMYYLKQE